MGSWRVEHGWTTELNWTAKDEETRTSTWRISSFSLVNGKLLPVVVVRPHITSLMLFLQSDWHSSTQDGICVPSSGIWLLRWDPCCIETGGSKFCVILMLGLKNVTTFVWLSLCHITQPWHPITVLGEAWTSLSGETTWIGTVNKNWGPYMTGSIYHHICQ